MGVSRYGGAMSSRDTTGINLSMLEIVAESRALSTLRLRYGWPWPRLKLDWFKSFLELANGHLRKVLYG